MQMRVYNYQISKFYTRVITRTLQAPSINTTRRLHAFYAHVGAAIPLTGNVRPGNFLAAKDSLQEIWQNKSYVIGKEKERYKQKLSSVNPAFWTTKDEESVT